MDPIQLYNALKDYVLTVPQEEQEYRFLENIYGDLLLIVESITTLEEWIAVARMAAIYKNMKMEKEASTLSLILMDMIPE